jgi:hypothetical protein
MSQDTVGTTLLLDIHMIAPEDPALSCPGMLAEPEDANTPSAIPTIAMHDTIGVSPWP